MKKRLLSALLAVCLMFGSAAALPEGYFGDGSQISASADSSQGYTYTVQSDGSAKITRADSTLRSQSTVTIPDTLDEHKVTVLGASNAVGIFAGLAGMLNSSIKTLIVPSSVKTIEASALSKMSGVTTVTLNEGLTSIGGAAFLSCSALKSITIPSSVTSVSSSAFEKCTSLAEITVKSGNSSYCSEDGIVYNKSKTEIVLCPLGKTSVTIPETITSMRVRLKICPSSAASLSTIMSQLSASRRSLAAPRSRRSLSQQMSHHSETRLSDTTKTPIP